MQIYERIASSLIGTPVQGLAEGVRGALALPNRLRHPELREIYLEEGRARELVARAVTHGMNCIDIGCHLGSVLDRFVRMSPSGRHIAVEPIPYKAAWLRRKYPGVEVHQIALGDEGGVLEFYYDPRNSGFSSLRPHGSGEKKLIEVPCKRLDDIVPAGRPIGFIKLDVEGAEFGVFRGARRVLAESRPLVLFECTRSGLSAFGFEPHQIFDLLTGELGYCVYLLKDWLSGSDPVDLDGFAGSMIYPFTAFNYVAAPRPRRD
jgi:FkbM family methyltransferase